MILYVVPLERFWLLSKTEHWVDADDDGVLESPPNDMMVPPVIVKVFWSQSMPPSGDVVPKAYMVPPLTVIVPLESMASLLVL